jgi:hypothetical protein
MFFLKKGVGSTTSLHSTNNVKTRLRSYTDIQGVFKKRPNFLNSSPTSIEGALRLLSAPSGRFCQQTAICPVSL